MDPFYQAAIGLAVFLATLAFGVTFVLPAMDRFAAWLENRNRPLPPAE